MNMLVSGGALLLAAVAFFASDLITFRANLITNTSIQAQIIGLERSFSADLQRRAIGRSNPFRVRAPRSTSPTREFIRVNAGFSPGTGVTPLPNPLPCPARRRAGSVFIFWKRRV